MQIVESLVIGKVRKVDSDKKSVPKKVSKEEKEIRIAYLVSEYNEMARSQKGRKLTIEEVGRAKEIIWELKQLKLFRPRKAGFS